MGSRSQVPRSPHTAQGMLGGEVRRAPVQAASRGQFVRGGNQEDMAKSKIHNKHSRTVHCLWRVRVCSAKSCRCDAMADWMQPVRMQHVAATPRPAPTRPHPVWRCASWAAARVMHLAAPFNPASPHPAPPGATHLKSCSARRLQQGKAAQPAGQQRRVGSPQEGGMSCGSVLRERTRLVKCEA